MKQIHAELTITDTPTDPIASDVDTLSEHYFPGNHYRRTLYIRKAIAEKVNRDKARLARAEKAKK